MLSTNDVQALFLLQQQPSDDQIDHDLFAERNSSSAGAIASASASYYRPVSAQCFRQSTKY